MHHTPKKARRRNTIEAARFPNTLEIMAEEFICRRPVEFAETDMAGIAHFSNFFRWMESAEAALFASLGFPLIVAEGPELTGWPRVRTACEYHAPLKFGDALEIRLQVKAVKARAVEYTIRFYRMADGAAAHVATGSMTAVHARRNPQTGAMESATIPPALRERLEALASSAQ